MGVAALSVAQSAATEAPKTKDCELSRLGFDMIAIAQPNLAAGAEVVGRGGEAVPGLPHAAPADLGEAGRGFL
jgi:hypothetical protein